MSNLIQVNHSDLEEGEVFCKYLYNRVIKNNKNFLGAELGPTGSGKSYRDLRKAELWYKKQFNEPFPPKNICFGTISALRRIKSGELRRGEVLIFEEAGVNMGSLDFQSKIVKLFTYILQSFRAMNICIFFNLPYLSMLSKQARLLMHYSGESAGIDFKTKQNKCKPFFHQVNQGTGKIYKKYMRVNSQKKMVTLKRMNYSLPSQYLIDAYERKKTQYLADITEEYTIELEKLEEKKLIKEGRKEMTETQIMVYNYACMGLFQREIAEKLGMSQQNVNGILKTIKKHGYKIKIEENPKENPHNKIVPHIITPVT